MRFARYVATSTAGVGKCVCLHTKPMACICVECTDDDCLRHVMMSLLLTAAHIQFKLADMATGLEASRAMVRQAAAALDAKSSRATLTAAMAKRFATDTCFGVANDALQLLGGYGYLQVGNKAAGALVPSALSHQHALCTSEWLET